MLPHLARYWSTDFKNNCPVLDDTEGISLRSVGGIFIGSVTGFALAMLVFLVEVVFLQFSYHLGRIFKIISSFQKWAQLNRVKNQVCIVNVH